MSTQPPPTTPRNPGRRAASFLGWSFAISLLLHLIVLPFFHGNKPEAKKETVSQLKVTTIPTPKPTPKPTPPPTPTPPPKQTPPPKPTPKPVAQKQPPKIIKLHVVHLTTKGAPSQDKAYVAPPKGSEEGTTTGVPNGTGHPNTAAPGPEKTGVPATPVPTLAPTPTPKPTLACPNPTADAAVRGTPVEPEYPDIAREQGAVGTAIVKVTLSATGAVVSATINKSAGNAALDQSAIAAAKATSYTPDIVDCVKTAGSYLFSANFTSQ